MGKRIIFTIGCLFTLLLGGDAYLDHEVEIRQYNSSMTTVQAISNRIAKYTPDIVVDESEEEIAVARNIPEPIIEEYQPQVLSGWFNVFQPSNLTADDIIRMLGESRSTMRHLAQAFVNAEDVYGVNALYLASTIGWESGWARYHSGWNNVAGWKYSTGWADFNSEYECIMTVAEGLSTHFRESVGDYLGDITSMYCPEPGYTDNILTIMWELEQGYYYN